MNGKTPITIEWLKSHGFKKLTGMQPVGLGEEYNYKLSNNETINVQTSPDSCGNYPLHMSVRSKQSKIELSKKVCDYEKKVKNCFYVEELLTLLDLTDNGNLKEFFI